MAMLDHEAVLHLGSLAKYRAAFLVDRASLPPAAPVRAVARSRPWLRGAPSIAARIDRVTALIHLYRLCAEAPKRAATSGMPASVNDLPDGFFLKLWCKSLLTHKLTSHPQRIGQACLPNQPRSKDRPGLSTKTEAVQAPNLVSIKPAAAHSNGASSEQQDDPLKPRWLRR
jgi:hypothetical protein